MIRNDSFFRMKENRSQRNLFFILFGMVFFGLFYIFRYYLWTFLFALIFYMALKPVHDRIRQTVKREAVSATLVMILLFLVILVPLFFVLLALVDQTFHFYIFVQDKISSGALRDLYNSSAVQGMLRLMDMEEADLLHEMVVFAKESALSTFSGITLLLTFPLTFMIKFFFMILMLFFLLKDGGNLGSLVYKILPFPDEIEKDVVERLKEVIKVLLAGNLLIMVLQGSMVGLGLFISGFSAPLLWGTIAGVLSLIPVVGTTFIWLPAVIYLAVSGSYLMALFLGLWSLFWYLVLENLLKPIVFGEKLHFHPVIFFFLLLGSIQAFGLAGVIIGPLLLTLFYSLWEIYKLFDVYDADRRSREKSNDSSIIE